ncbi:DUF2062 domain-containing protein, partial [Thiolapillus sp.]|uniref:DUF2062 domain-containing protein n=3 Tax=Thiolapillus sp. TaxID=2017437 RepID=UPI003AF61E6C
AWFSPQISFMPRHLLRQYTPDPKKLCEHKHMRIFGKYLADPNLWHLNRRSVSGAFAVGLFWAMIPMPLQMVAAAATAIPARVNLPVSVALVWLSNPLTMPPIFYFNYLVGTWLLPHQEPLRDMEMSLEWFTHSMGEIWQPLYVGSVVVGVVLGALGYITMRMYWRWHVVSQYRKRQQARSKPSSS